jgi:hypothetical protein
MKLMWFFLSGILFFSLFFPAIIYDYQSYESSVSEEEFFFGMSFGLNSTEEAKLLIDKVKGYTNLFIINSWEISTNETALNEICDYAVDAEMSFIVFFDYISHIGYPWHLTWLNQAKQNWGDRFLGVYLYDEPGGRQIDLGKWDEGIVYGNITDYDEAANFFITSISSTWSMQDLKNKNITVFSSDYALYWFDYLAGYDTLFVELGWNHSRIQQIALGKGAANVQDKDWGAILTWTYEQPPYLANGTQLLQDMITAYQAGAKYIVIFNYPKLNPYGILEEEHFNAMETFWDITHSPSQNSFQDLEENVAFVLPKNYGWGMRESNDSIWFPEWGPDQLSPLIWENMNNLIEQYGLNLDIIYYDSRFNFMEKYSNIYFWDDFLN